MITLQDLKDKIEELENGLPEGLTLENIPLGHTVGENYNILEVEIYQPSLGFYFACITIE